MLPRKRLTPIDSVPDNTETADVTSPSLPLPRSEHRVRSFVVSRWQLVTGLAAVALLLLLAGAYVLGAHRSSTHLTSGTAYSTPFQIGASTHDWQYDIPLQIQWRDSTGAWNDGSRPACLPPANRTMPVKFAWVPVTVAGVSWRAVVWVDCS
jgi:hypothetical protein